MNGIAEFVRDACIVGTNYYTTKEAIYRKYLAYCELNSYRSLPWVYFKYELANLGYLESLTPVSKRWPKADSMPVKVFKGVTVIVAP